MDNNMMKVVMVEPGKPAYVTEIPHNLEGYKAAIGDGLIEVIPYLEDALMIGNEEAKLIGMEGNRRFGDMIVAGPFFICGEAEVDGEYDFCSLSDELCDKYVNRFSKPEQISKEEVEADMGFTFISF